jgi:hypothetical protein
VPLDPLQARPDYAEKQFDFLAPLGFKQIDRWISGGESFKDGWKLIYQSNAVLVSVEYLDMQFDVCFVRNGVSASYFALDRNLFGRRSGFYGNMFPTEKLANAIDRVAADVRDHYETILTGSLDSWAAISNIVEQPESKRPLS